MCWRCDHPEATYDDYLGHVQDEIMGHGLAVEFVEHAERPLAYTVGLSDHGVPELLITGLDVQVSHRVLHCTAHQIIDDGVRIEPPTLIDYDDGLSVELVEVDHPEVHLELAVRLCGNGIRALQLVWADGHGRLPWDPLWSHGRRRQPVLGSRPQRWI